MKKLIEAAKEVETPVFMLNFCLKSEKNKILPKLIIKVVVPSGKKNIDTSIHKMTVKEGNTLLHDAKIAMPKGYSPSIKGTLAPKKTKKIKKIFEIMYSAPRLVQCAVVSFLYIIGSKTKTPLPFFTNIVTPLQ